MIKDKTIIGEYVGGYFNNHLENYSEEEIIFFGVVDKNYFLKDLINMQDS